MAQIYVQGLPVDSVRVNISPMPIPSPVLGLALAVVIGVTLGLLGGGGSILTVPVLVYVMGYPMKQAVPMSLIVVGLTSAFGIVAHHRRGAVRWNTALAFGPPAMVGAFLGARAAAVVSSRAQLAVFGGLLLLAAVSMYFGPGLWNRGTGPKRRSPLAVAVIGGAVGVLTGLVGVGGGFMYVPALVLLAGLAMHEAVGTSLVLIVLSCLAGFLSYMGRVVVPWPTLSLFTSLAIVGVLVGGAAAAMVPAQQLRRGFAMLLVVMGILVLAKPR